MQVEAGLLLEKDGSLTEIGTEFMQGILFSEVVCEQNSCLKHVITAINPTYTQEECSAFTQLLVRALRRPPPRRRRRQSVGAAAEFS